MVSTMRHTPRTIHRAALPALGSLATALLCLPALGQSHHLGWCHGVHNPHHNSGCAAGNPPLHTNIHTPAVVTPGPSQQSGLQQPTPALVVVTTSPPSVWVEQQHPHAAQATTPQTQLVLQPIPTLVLPTPQKPSVIVAPPNAPVFVQAPQVPAPTLRPSLPPAALPVPQATPRPTRPVPLAPMLVPPQPVTQTGTPVPQAIPSAQAQAPQSPPLPVPALPALQAQAVVFVRPVPQTPVTASNPRPTGIAQPVRPETPGAQVVTSQTTTPTPTTPSLAGRPGVVMPSSVPWVVAAPGRQMPHALPTRLDATGTAPTTHCIASGFGWRREQQADGQWRVIGAHPYLRTTEYLVRDIPANHHSHAHCLVEVGRHHPAFEHGSSQQP